MAPSPTCTAPRWVPAPGALLVVIGAPVAAGELAQRAAAAATAGHPHVAVVLADLTRHGVLDGCAGRPRSGLGPLLEASRLRVPPPEVVGSLLAPTHHGHRRLVGLGHPLDWTAVRATAAERAVTALARSDALVVALVDADLEGEGSTGSIDVEERHALARHAVRAATAVAVAEEPGPIGATVAQLVAREVRARRASPDVAVLRLGAAGRSIGGRPGRAGVGSIGQLVTAALVAPAPASTTALGTPIVPGEIGRHDDPRPVA